MRFPFINLCVLLVPAAQVAATAFPHEITLEGAIIELRDSFKTKAQGDFVASTGSTMASIQDTLFHVTAALDQLNDEEAATANIQHAIAKLYSVMGGDAKRDNIDWRRRQLVASDKNILSRASSKDNMNGLRGAAEDDNSEAAIAQIAIIKKCFKDAIANVHFALEDDEKSNYLGQRILQLGRGQDKEMGKDMEMDKDMEMGQDMDMAPPNFAIGEKALENIFDGFLNGGNEFQKTAVLDVIGVLLSLPVSALQESVTFMVEYTSHQLTCLRNEESTARMQMILFVDFLVRLGKGLV